MSLHNRYHAVVVGAGLVGAAAALALSRAGLRVALIEPRLPPAHNDARAGLDNAGRDARAEFDDAGWDARMYAINPGNADFLDGLGAWQKLDTARIQAVYRMEVAGDAGGHLRMDAYEAGVPRLATILESGNLQGALWKAVREQAMVDLFCPASVVSIEWGTPHSTLMLEDGTAIQAELVVGADGIQSGIREMAGIQAHFSPYQQSGVVANFVTEKPHSGTAHQWFRSDFSPGDVVAFLPLPGNRMSLVWSTATAHAQELMSLDVDAFCRQVQAAGHAQLGQMKLITPPAAFPLRLMQPVSTVAPGCVLVGDAAHGVHPLAGQGVNLGFGDVAALVQVLSQRGRANCGELTLLMRYARRRAEPVARMQWVTDKLWRLFEMQAPLASMTRNTGMSVLNSLGPLKSALVHEALFT